MLSKMCSFINMLKVKVTKKITKFTFSPMNKNYNREV